MHQKRGLRRRHRETASTRHSEGKRRTTPPLMITTRVPLMRGVVTVLALSRSVAETNITQSQNQP